MTRFEMREPTTDGLATKPDATKTEHVTDNAKSVKPKRLTPKRVFVILATLPFLLFCFSLLGRQIFWAELVTNFRCQLMFGMFGSLLVMVLARKWWLAAIVSVGLAWSMLGVVSVYIPSSQPAPGATVIKIMSFNVWTKNLNTESVLQRIQEHDPDVLVVVEYANHWEETLRALDHDYPYQILQARWHGFGVAVFSKLPMKDRFVHQLLAHDSDNPMISGIIDVDGKRLRIAAAHVLSPTNKGRLDRRNLQLVEAGKILASDETPTVLLGDLNCTPWSPFLQDFMAMTKYRDSRQGFGYHGTWPSPKWYAMVPIDHALVSETVHVHSRTIGEAAGSDHLPLIVEVSVGE